MGTEFTSRVMLLIPREPHTPLRTAVETKCGKNILKHAFQCQCEKKSCYIKFSHFCDYFFLQLRALEAEFTSHVTPNIPHSSNYPRRTEMVTASCIWREFWWEITQLDDKAWSPHPPRQAACQPTSMTLWWTTQVTRASLLCFMIISAILITWSRSNERGVIKQLFFSGWAVEQFSINIYPNGNLFVSVSVLVDTFTHLCLHIFVSRLPLLKLRSLQPVEKYSSNLSH